MLGFAVRAQEARGHHRGQRQRHHQRDEDRHRQRHREFTEQPADDAAHQQQRDQNRHQRDADRDDGEADFAGAPEGGGQRLFALLDIARDVFQHHDGVVDDEADRDRQRHQREVVERIAERPHQRAGAEQRKRHGDGRNHGRPEAAQEDEDHHDHQHDGDQKRELHVSTAARMVSVRSLMILILIAGGMAAINRGKLRLDAVDGVDDVGAGLLEDDEEDAALAVGPGGLLHVFGPGDGPADVANPQRSAVAIGDDDVVPVLGVQQLVVGVDRVGARRAVDIALRAVDGGDRDLVADVFQLQALGHQFRGVDLDPDRGLLLAADEHLGDARNLADLLRRAGRRPHRSPGSAAACPRSPTATGSASPPD